MTKQEKYNILCTFDRQYIAKKLGVHYDNLGQVNCDLSKLYNELMLTNPLFLVQDYDLCKVELKSKLQHTCN